MKSSIFFFLIIFFYMFISCTEDYKFPILDGQSVIVITGLITNEAGPYYVKVEEIISNISTEEFIVRGVNDARITITDSNGNKDELRSFCSLPIETEVLEYWPYKRDYYKIPDGEGGYIEFETYSTTDTREGRYFTTSIKGQPGRMYTLKVEYGGKEYIATDYMCYGTVIDSVSVEPIGRYIYDKPDDSDGFLVPCLYFSEPQNEVNFYMFKYYAFQEPDESYVYIEPLKNLSLGKIIGSGADWLISVVSDRFMPPYVNKYKMSDGDHGRKWFNGTDMGFLLSGWENGGTADMYCITEPVYRFYYALSQQYYDDGGAFSPSPASPPTNFSSGAQGCFSAASVSQYVLKLWE